MGRTTGLEPATFGTTIQHSNQLSYVRRKIEIYDGKKKTYLSIKLFYLTDYQDWEAFLEGRAEV